MGLMLDIDILCAKIVFKSLHMVFLGLNEKLRYVNWLKWDLTSWNIHSRIGK